MRAVCFLISGVLTAIFRQQRIDSCELVVIKLNDDNTDKPTTVHSHKKISSRLRARALSLATAPTSTTQDSMDIDSKQEQLKGKKVGIGRERVVRVRQRRVVAHVFFCFFFPLFCIPFSLCRSPFTPACT